VPWPLRMRAISRRWSPPLRRCTTRTRWREIFSQHPACQTRCADEPPSSTCGNSGWRFLDDWRIEVREVVDADPWVVCDVHWHATGKGSEISIDWRVTEAHRFKDGKIASSIFGYPDVATALQAIEQSE
jgi:hypothetical protein